VNEVTELVNLFFKDDPKWQIRVCLKNSYNSSEICRLDKVIKD